MSGPYIYRHLKSYSSYTVGFWNQEGQWEGESGHATAEEAAARVHYLNGGTDKPALTGSENQSKVADAKPGPLVRLETGDWIDVADVKRVSPERVEEAVLVYLESGMTLWFRAIGEPTQELADRIAAQINAARRGEPS